MHETDKVHFEDFMGGISSSVADLQQQGQKPPLSRPCNQALQEDTLHGLMVFSWAQVKGRLQLVSPRIPGMSPR